MQGKVPSFDCCTCGNPRHTHGHEISGKKGLYVAPDRQIRCSGEEWRVETDPQAAHMEHPLEFTRNPCDVTANAVPKRGKNHGHITRQHYTHTKLLPPTHEPRC